MYVWGSHGHLRAACHLGQSIISNRLSRTHKLAHGRLRWRLMYVSHPESINPFPRVIVYGLIIDVDSIQQHPRAGKVRLVAPPVTYNGMRMPVRRPPPWLSQHTKEVRVHVRINGDILSVSPPPSFLQFCIAFRILHSNHDLVVGPAGTRVLSE